MEEGKGEREEKSGRGRRRGEEKGEEGGESMSKLCSTVVCCTLQFAQSFYELADTSQGS